MSHPLMICLAVLAGVAAGAGLGVLRTPKYQSTAILTVGQPTSSAQSVPGYAAALEALAGSYSRVATSAKVGNRTAQSLGVSLANVQARVSASQIPKSSLFAITAAGSTARSAVATANATASSIIAYAADSGTEPDRVLADYEKAQRDLGRATGDLKRLQGSRTGGDVLVRAQAAVAAQKLKTTTLGNAYQQAQDNSGRTSVEVLTPAASAGSDRRSKVEMYMALGFVLGLAVSVGGYTFLDNLRAPVRIRPIS